MNYFRGNTLVVYYSRTGRCEKIAAYLKELLHADLDRLKDKQDYSGPKGLAICSLKAILRRPTVLAPNKFDPSYYDDVILVSPIWAGKTCPAIRTYVASHADKFRRASLVTCGGLSTKKGVRNELAHDYGLTLDRTLGVTIDDVDHDIFGHHLRRFVASDADRDVDPYGTKPDPQPVPQPADSESVAADDTYLDALRATEAPKTGVRPDEYGENPYYAYPSDSLDDPDKETSMNKNETAKNAKASASKQNNAQNNAQNEAQNNARNSRSNAQNNAQNNEQNNAQNNARSRARNEAQNSARNEAQNGARNKGGCKSESNARASHTSNRSDSESANSVKANSRGTSSAKNSK